jgi:hypothetical protein
MHFYLYHTLLNRRPFKLNLVLSGALKCYFDPEVGSVSTVKHSRYDLGKISYCCCLPITSVPLIVGRDKWKFKGCMNVSRIQPQILENTNAQESTQITCGHRPINQLNPLSLQIRPRSSQLARLFFYVHCGALLFFFGSLSSSLTSGAGSTLYTS